MRNLRENAEDIEKELEKLRIDYEKEVDSILDDLYTKINKIDTSIEPEIFDSDSDSNSDSRKMHSIPGSHSVSSKMPSMPSSHYDNPTLTPTPTPTPTPTSTPTSTSDTKNNNPKWKSTWHGPVLNPEPDMTPDEYYKKYGKNEPSWRKTIRHQGLTGLAKRIWRGTNPMQDIAWRYADNESIRGLPTIKEYIEFKKIVDFYVDPYFPINEGENEMQDAFDDAKIHIKKALINFIRRIHSVGQGLKMDMLKDVPTANADHIDADIVDEPNDEPSVDADVVNEPVNEPVGEPVGEPVNDPVEPASVEPTNDLDVDKIIAGVKKKTGKKINKNEIIEKIKTEIVNELLPNIHEKLKEKGLDITRWFKWQKCANKSLDTDEKIKNFAIVMQRDAFQNLTDSSDSLIELAAFLLIQSTDYENAENYLKNITNNLFTGDGKILNKILSKTALSDASVREKIQEKYQELKKTIPHAIDLQISKSYKEPEKSNEPSKSEEEKEEARLQKAYAAIDAGIDNYELNSLDDY
jgi:hypothetical protein